MAMGQTLDRGGELVLAVVRSCSGGREDDDDDRGRDREQEGD